MLRHHSSPSGTPNFSLKSVTSRPLSISQQFCDFCLATLPQQSRFCTGATQTRGGNEFLAAERSDCAHNWNPPESQVKMIPWQAARRGAGASLGCSCHEIQYQSLLNGAMMLQISVRPPKRGHKPQNTDYMPTHTTRGAVFI